MNKVRLDGRRASLSTAVAARTPTRAVPSEVGASAPPRSEGDGERRRWFSRRLRVRFSPTDWFVAALFFSASVTPSLYPRPRLSQGVLSGIAVALGFGAGRAASRLLGKVGPGRLPAKVRSATRITLALVSVAVASWALLLNYHWQVDVRRLMAIDGSAALYLASIVPVTLVTGYALVLLARLVRAGHRGYVRLVWRVVPRRARGLAHVVVASLLMVFVLDVVIAGEIVAAVNDRLIAADTSSDPDVRQPHSRYRSGSPESLVPWDTLGRMGRRFVADEPTVEQLSGYSGTPALPPIRVYVGLGSAASVRERADLAVAELERTGALERDVLTVITPTGTGSVNRHAIAPLEYMYNGNTAAVAMQYSYLPSWLVMGGNQDRAKVAARTLFDAVARRLEQRPSSGRPLVLLYGESLGSFGSEQIFTGLADIRAHANGVLWVGPPRANRLWREFTAARDAGSPVWQPVYQGAETVRFGSDGAGLSQPRGRWTAPRVAYLQHASDPVTWWTPDLLFNRPVWLRDSRPPDISDKMPYVPVVTFVQTTIDLVLGGNAPLGHGHMFATEQAEAWALIAPPRGWSPADTTRLLTRLDE
ncbi:MAG: alpha/beta-hydrolase family protein [Actinomycetota bacterium]|nr:alpha/beta-hydrolase family protein [Actinomycetota bacterium]